MTSTVNGEARGPQEIRAAFTTAVDTTSGHTKSLSEIAGVLHKGADRYETLGMSSSTLGHLRGGAAAVTAATAALDTAGERLQAALADFNDRDGQVGDAVAEAGNLMQPGGYTITFDPTGVQEQPMTSPAAHPPAPADTTTPAEPQEPTERDLLARGAYIAPWPPQWQPDRAREWDAGRVPDDQRAAAYEHADAILTERAQIAGGPGADRLESMRGNGILRCPPWCPQDDDEHDHEAHIGPGSTFTTEDGDTVTVRPRVSWWSDIEPAVELTVTPAEGGDGTLVLTAAELRRLNELSNAVLRQAEDQHNDDALESGKPAYPGAFTETAGDDYDVDDPAAAAAALDLQTRAGAYYPDEDSGEHADDDSTGPYLDWSSRLDDGARHLEVSDGTDTTALTLTAAELRELRDDIGRLVGAGDHAEDPDQLNPGDPDEGAYIDWSVTENDVRCIEFGDGVDAVQLELTDAQLREWHQRLDLQVQLDEQHDRG